MKNSVVINSNLCIGCGKCAADCVSSRISIINGKATFENGTCLECGHCFAVCPVCAVEMTGYDVSDCDTMGNMANFDSDELLLAMKEGRLEEAWGCGTAAVVSPIGRLMYEDKEYVINGEAIGPVTQKLYDTLTGIQWGKIADQFGWSVKVKEGLEDRYIATHEFAHTVVPNTTIPLKNYVGYDVKPQQSARRELNRLFGEYKEKVQNYLRIVLLMYVMHLYFPV